jgi:DNA-directed RNA polymerase subunit RPC12/RpoP
MSACTRKITYVTRKAAKKAVKRIKAKGKIPAEEYHCPECGFYHLTKKRNMNYKVIIRNENTI